MYDKLSLNQCIATKGFRSLNCFDVFTRKCLRLTQAKWLTEKTKEWKTQEDQK